MSRKLNFILAACLSAATLFGQGGGARATSWGHRTPGQFDVPQDKDLNYYIDNVWLLDVKGKATAQTKAEWTELNRKRLTAYCVDSYTLTVYPTSRMTPLWPMGVG